MLISSGTVAERSFFVIVVILGRIIVVGYVAPSWWSWRTSAAANASLRSPFVRLSQRSHAPIVRSVVVCWILAPVVASHAGVLRWWARWHAILIWRTWPVCSVVAIVAGFRGRRTVSHDLLARRASCCHASLACHVIVIIFVVEAWSLGTLHSGSNTLAAVSSRGAWSVIIACDSATDGSSGSPEAFDIFLGVVIYLRAFLVERKLVGRTLWEI